MSLAEYLSLSDKVASVGSRAEAVALVESIQRADLHPVDRRVLARRLAKAAQSIDPGLALELVTTVLPTHV